MLRSLCIVLVALSLQACAATKIVTAPVKVVTGTVNTAVDVVD